MSLLYWNTERIIARGEGWLISCVDEGLNSARNDLIIKWDGKEYIWISNNDLPLVRLERYIEANDINRSYLIFINRNGQGQIFLDVTNQDDVSYQEYKRNEKNSFLSFSGSLQKETSLENGRLFIKGLASSVKNCAKEVGSTSRDLLITARGRNYYWDSNKSKPLTYRTGQYNPPYDSPYTFLTSINGDGFIRIKNSDKGVLEASHGMDSFYEEFQFNERGDLVLYRGSIDRTD